MQEQKATKKWAESEIDGYKTTPFYWLRQNKKEQQRTLLQELQRKEDTTLKQI